MLAQHDAASPLFLAPLLSIRSPDFTKAMLRASLPASDAWVAQVAAVRCSVRAHLGKAPPVSRPLANSVIRAALSSARRSTWQALCPDPHLQASTSLRGRARRRARSGPEVLCPLWDTLDPRVADLPCYLHSPDSAALCIMTLRIAHLPGDYCDEAQACYFGDTCGPSPSFPALALPSPAASSDEASMDACPRLRAPAAVAICSVPLAHALVSSDDDISMHSTPRDSRFRVSRPPTYRPAIRGAEADGFDPGA